MASDALGINIYIFQNSDGQILRVRSLGGLACKDIFVKFTHNPIHNLGNHYDAILMKPDFQNLDLLLNAAVSEIIEPKSVNKKPPPAHHKPPPSTQLQSPSLPNQWWIQDFLLGGHQPIGGYQPPTCTPFGKNVCENERN